MIRTKIARKVLTKAEQRHLTKEANIHSMKTFRSARKQQQDMKVYANAGREPCMICKRIALKLGIES